MSPVKQIVLCAALLAAAAGGWYAMQKADSAGTPPTAAAPGAPAAGGSRIPGLISGGAVNVITTAVQTDAGGETVVALGTARAPRSVTIYPQVTGIVTEVLFEAGRQVEAGDVLVRLDEDEQAVMVDRARIALEQARSTVERSQTLAESRTISQVALSDAQTAAQLAEVELRSAEIALDRRSINAPFSGTPGLAEVAVGDLVTTTTALTTLDDLSTVRVDFEVPERWSASIRPGHPVTATAPAMPGSRFPGSITGIDSRIDPVTRTLRLRAELENRDDALKTGMAISAEMHFDSAEHLAVPTLSVQWDRRGSFVWKVVEGAARRAAIDIVRRESGVVVVQGELAAGDSVVVEGVQRLREGAKVAEVGETPVIIDETVGPEPSGEPAISGAEAPPRARS